MGRLAEQLFAAVVILSPVLMLVVAPLTFYIFSAGPTRRRALAAAIGGYLIVAVITGFYAYAVVPADYTRDHRWTRQPAANALGEIHGAALEQMRHPGAMSPGAAAAWREQIGQEQQAFLGNWCVLTSCGMVPLALLLLRFPVGGPRKGNALTTR